MKNSWNRLAATLGLVALLAAFGCSDNFEKGQAAFDAGDYAAALSAWEPLAGNGDARAQYRVGLMLEEGLGCEAEPARALELFRQSAEGGDRDAQYKLGYLYAVGSDLVEPSEEESFQWVLKAARQDHPMAQYYLGKLYERGAGVHRDWGEAAEWYRRSAEQGYPKGMNALGILLSMGKGVQKDEQAAAHWITQAADAGEAGAQLNAAHLYASGLGVDQDYRQSYKWLTVFLDQGGKETALKLDFIRTKLTTEELDEAEALVEEYRAKVAARTGS